MRENRQLIWLLVIYIVAQIASLYVGAFALIYLLVYPDGVGGWLAGGLCIYLK